MPEQDESKSNGHIAGMDALGPLALLMSARLHTGHDSASAAQMAVLDLEALHQALNDRVEELHKEEAAAKAHGKPDEPLPPATTASVSVPVPAEPVPLAQGAP